MTTSTIKYDDDFSDSSYNRLRFENADNPSIYFSNIAEIFDEDDNGTEAKFASKISETRRVARVSPRVVDREAVAKIAAGWDRIARSLASMTLFQKKFASADLQDELVVLDILASGSIPNSDTDPLFVLCRNAIIKTVFDPVTLDALIAVGLIGRLFVRRAAEPLNSFRRSKPLLTTFPAERLEYAPNATMSTTDLETFEASYFGRDRPLELALTDNVSPLRYFFVNTRNRRNDHRLASMHELTKKLLDPDLFRDAKDAEEAFAEAFRGDSLRLPDGNLLDTSFVPKLDLDALPRRPQRTRVDADISTTTTTSTSSYEKRLLSFVERFDANPSLRVPDEFVLFFETFPFFDGWHVDRDRRTKHRNDIVPPNEASRLYVYTAALEIAAKGYEKATLHKVSLLLEAHLSAVEMVSCAVYSRAVLERVLTMRVLALRFGKRLDDATELPLAQQIDSWLALCSLENAASGARNKILLPNTDVPTGSRVAVNELTALIQRISTNSRSFHDAAALASRFYLPDVYALPVYEMLKRQKSREAIYVFLTLLLQNGEDPNHRLLRDHIREKIPRWRTSKTKNVSAAILDHDLARYERFASTRRVLGENTSVAAPAIDPDTDLDTIDRFAFLYLYYVRPRNE